MEVNLRLIPFDTRAFIPSFYRGCWHERNQDLGSKIGRHSDLIGLAGTSSWLVGSGKNAAAEHVEKADKG